MNNRTTCAACGSDQGNPILKLADGNCLCAKCFKAAGYRHTVILKEKNLENVLADMQPTTRREKKKAEKEAIKEAKKNEKLHEEEKRSNLASFGLDITGSSTFGGTGYTASEIISEHLKKLDLNGNYSPDPVENLKICLSIIQMEQNNIIIKQNEKMLNTLDRILLHSI